MEKVIPTYSFVVEKDSWNPIAEREIEEYRNRGFRLSLKTNSSSDIRITSSNKDTDYKIGYLFEPAE